MLFSPGYEVRSRGIDLISHAPPFGRLWYDGPEARQQFEGGGPLGRLLSGSGARKRSTSLCRLTTNDFSPSLPEADAFGERDYKL